MLQKNVSSNQTLKDGVKAGTLNQTKGTGASGSFKLAEKPQAAKKPKKAANKPAAKKTAPKKDTTKKHAARKLPSPRNQQLKIKQQRKLQRSKLQACWPKCVLLLVVSKSFGFVD